MGLDLGKFLRDRKDQAVRQWQDSVVLDAVSSGTKADNARRQVVADKERALDVGRSQAVKFQGQQFREGKIDRDKLLSNINSIVGFDTLEDQGLRKQGDLYFNTQKDNNVNTFLNNAGSAIMNAAPQRVIGGAAEYGGTLIGNEDIRDFGQKISQPYRDFGAAAQENAGNKVVATGSQVVGNLLTLPLNPAGKVGMATRFATAALPRAADTSFAIRQGGGSENAQKIGGGAVGSVSGVMNTLGGEKVLKPFTGVASKAANPLTKLLTTKLAPRVAGRVLAAGNMEGLEEVTETGVENLVAQKTFDPNRKLTDNLAQSYVLGAGMGSAVRGGVELGSMRSSTTPTQLTPEVQNKRNNLANAYTTLVDQGRPDQAAYFAREIDQIDNPAPGTLRERIRSAKDVVMSTRLMQDEGGFVQISQDPIKDVEAKIKQLNPNLDTTTLNDRQKRIALANIEQQQGRSNVDTGQKMFGSKKDMAKMRKITAENIQEIENEGERVAAKMVTKARVLGEDSKYAVNRSGDPGVENYKKLAVSAIPSTPAQNPEARGWYVKNTDAYIQKVKAATSIAEVKQAAKEYLDSASMPKEFTSWDGTVKTVTKNDANKYLGSRSYNMLRGYSSAMRSAEYRPPTDFSFDEKKTTTRVTTDGKPKPQIHGGEQVEYERKGAPGLKNKDPKSMVKDFGFKGLEYGNYVKNVESNEHMAKFGDSMLDLEKVLGIDMSALNTQAKLGVGFGSRGSGMALAHYEPSNKVINITKKNTVDGSLAHEYMHAIDDFLGSGGHSYASNGKAVKPATKQAMDELMSAIKKGDGSYSRLATLPENYRNPYRSWSAVDALIKNTGDAQATVNTMAANYPNTSKSQMDRMVNYVMDKTGAKEVQVPTGKSEFYSLAQAQGAYWERPTEMLARAFDGYIGNKLDRAGIKNNYVAKGSRSPGLMHPNEAHAKQLEPLFDNLFKAIKSDYNLPDPTLRATVAAAPTTPTLAIKPVQSQPTEKPKPVKSDPLDVPKKDLIIRNGGGKAMSIPTNSKGDPLKKANKNKFFDYKSDGTNAVIKPEHKNRVEFYESPFYEGDLLVSVDGKYAGDLVGGAQTKNIYALRDHLERGGKLITDDEHAGLFKSDNVAMSIDPLESLKQEARTINPESYTTNWRNGVSNGYTIKPTVGKKFSDEYVANLKDWYKSQGYDVTGSGTKLDITAPPNTGKAEFLYPPRKLNQRELRRGDIQDSAVSLESKKQTTVNGSGYLPAEDPSVTQVKLGDKLQAGDKVWKNGEWVDPADSKSTFIKDGNYDGGSPVYRTQSQPPKSPPVQKVETPVESKPQKPFTPISQPVDNLPAVVKQVTKKQTSEQKIAPPVVAPAVQKQTPAPRPTKTTKPKSPERLVVGGKSAEVSSDGRIANIDEFVKQQVAEQEAEPEKTGRISKLKRVWIDTLSPAEDNFRQAVKDGKLSQETLDDIIVKNGKSIRSGTAANINLVESGLVDLLHNKSKEDYDNLGQTLIAIHAKDLRANGIETGRDASLDEQIVAKYGEQFKADIEQFRDAANYVLDKSVASQLISKETADMLKKKYPNYVPMNRVMEELENTGSFNSSQIASIGKQTVVRKIKGSKRTVENPLESMISKVQDMTKQSLKNEAAITWVDALKKTGDAKLVEGAVKPGESTISVIRNGNKEIYSVEPEMEAAAKGLTKEQMGTITNAARKVSRVFKTGTTGLNLPFIVTNLARDQQNALLNQSKGELETFKAIPTAIMETLGHGRLYQEAVRNGAISTSFDLTKPNLKLTAANIRKRGSSLGALSKIEDVIGRSEEYTRIQQYKATKEYWLEQGMSESQAQNKATIAAQQNSADFARAGDLGQILNAWLPYTNAGVQGTRSTLRAAKNNPVRYATKAGAMLVMPTIMTALWNTGDEERKKIYDDISENDKQASFIVITPWAKKNEEGKWEGIVKIPKPPGISALLYPVEKGVASMNGLDPVGFKDIVKGVLGFGSPLGDNLNAAVSTVTPQAIKPAVEATINRNLFTNRDIVPYWLKDKPANEQAYKGSSGTARMISSLTGVSPIKVEHMIRGYGGELGLQGLNAADNALNKAGLIPKEQIGGISIPAGFKKRFTEAYDKPGSTIQRGTGAGASATAAKNYEDAVAGIKSSYGGKYAELTEAEVKELGKTDADAKDYYKTLQAVKQSSKTPDELPTNLNPLATSIYEKEARLTTDGKDKWNKRPSANKEVNNTIKSWLPKGVDAPRITNETTKKWADYEKKKAEGTLGKLEEESAKKTILRSAYNSVLTEDEKDLYTLSKDKLLDAYDRGVINDQNIDKALKVERQLFDAGLISTETLAKKLGLVARGYKGRSGGRGGRGGSSKIAKDTSVAFSNALQSTTLKRLNSLLAGTQSGGSTSRRVATSKPVLKKISVKA